MLYGCFSKQRDKILTTRCSFNRRINQATVNLLAIRKANPTKLREFKSIALDTDMRKLIILFNVWMRILIIDGFII